MRQDAWLDTVPDKWKVNRATRIYRDHGPAVYATWLPELGEEGRRWFSLLEDAGRFRMEPTMSGVLYQGLSWSDLFAWAKCVKEDFTSYDLRALRMLSVAYASQLNESRELDCPAPYQPPAPEDR